MQRIRGGVFISNNPNGLRGDIIARGGSEATSSTIENCDQQPPHKEELVLRWRGSQEEVPLNDSDLVEFPSNDTTKQEELIRFHISQKARANPDLFYLQEKLLTLELGDEFTFLIVSHSKENNSETLEPEVEAKALVRLVETYYVGQGTFVAHGRDLTSYQKALEPFWTIQGDGSYAKVPGNTVQDLLTNIRGIFERNFSVLLFCRAFNYCLFRSEYFQENESILDAYCVAFYAIKLLQGELDEFMNMEFGDVIEEELTHYKSANVDMTADDLLWCFCMIFLRIGTDVRRVIGSSNLNKMVLSTFGRPVANEEIMVAQLAVRIRPESPVSFLSSYRAAMDLKPLVPFPFRPDWMRTVYDFVMHGMEVAENWGDPYYLYTFHMITAYWMPTTSYHTTYSHQQLQDRIKTANEFKEVCKPEVPDYFLWVGEQHEESLQHLLALHVFDRDAAVMPALVDAYRYPVPPPPTSLSSVSRSSSPPSSSGPICYQCRKSCDKVVKCTQCHIAEYCSMACQGAHWRARHCDECIPHGAHACGHCGKVLQKKLSCSKCGMINYCNRKCQLAHWKGGHKKDCKILCGLGA